MVVAIGPPAIPQLHRLLDDDRWFVVRNAILLLRRLGDPDLAARMDELIEHDDPRVVAEVIRALAKSGDPRWLQVLQRLFLLDHPLAGKEALAAALQLRHPKVGELLLRLLERRRGTRLRDEETLDLIQALGGFPQPAVVEKLEKLASLSNWRYPFRLTAVWEAVAKAAARHEQPESDRVLEKIASQKDPAAEIARKLLEQRQEHP
jgi:HEAT repeat protein